MRNELELYEVLLLFRPDLTENELSDKLKFYEEFLTDNGCKIKIATHGRTCLRYPIDKFDVATATTIRFTGNGHVIRLLDSRLGRDVHVLRSCFTRIPWKTTFPVLAK